MFAAKDSQQRWVDIVTRPGLDTRTSQVFWHCDVTNNTFAGEHEAASDDSQVPRRSGWQQWSSPGHGSWHSWQQTGAHQLPLHLSCQLGAPLTSLQQLLLWCQETCRGGGWGQPGGQTSWQEGHTVRINNVSIQISFDLWHCAFNNQNSVACYTHFPLVQRQKLKLKHKELSRTDWRQDKEFVFSAELAAFYDVFSRISCNEESHLMCCDIFHISSHTPFCCCRLTAFQL